MYRAVVIGATGAVGSALVRELLASTACLQVTALARRPVEQFNGLPGREQLRVEVIDLRDIEAATHAGASGYELAFCTMGIGQPRKVPYEEFWRVDVEYAGAFARGAAAAGVRHISLLSSVGANAASRNKYLRVKGAAERAVIDAKLPRTSLFRPSLLVTAEIRYGLQDRVTQRFFPLIAPFLPRKYHQIRVEELARAMRLNGERFGGAGVQVLHYPEFRTLLGAAT